MCLTANDTFGLITTVRERTVSTRHTARGGLLPGRGLKSDLSTNLFAYVPQRPGGDGRMGPESHQEPAARFLVLVLVLVQT